MATTFQGNHPITDPRVTEQNVTTLNVSRWRGQTGTANTDITITHGRDPLDLRRVTVTNAATGVVTDAVVTHSNETTTVVRLATVGVYTITIAL